LHAPQCRCDRHASRRTNKKRDRCHCGVDTVIDGHRNHRHGDAALDQLGPHQYRWQSSPEQQGANSRQLSQPPGKCDHRNIMQHVWAAYDFMPHRPQADIERDSAITSD
jgi:hypothetical protein